MDAWYYEKDGKPSGPVTREELDALAMRGDVRSETRVWTQGMANWAAYRDLPPPSGAGAAAPLPAETERPASWGDAEAGAAEDRPGLPWEKSWDAGVWKAFWATVGAVLMRPSEGFSRMRVEEGAGKAVRFAVVAIMSAWLVSMAINYVFKRMMGPGAMGQQSLATATESVAGAVALFIMLVLGPIIVFVGLHLSAGMVHGMLLITGGAARPFDATLRVVAYTAGATGLLNAIPACAGNAILVCAGIVSLVWNVVSGSAGLEQVQGVSRTRGALAMLAPLILCCGLVALVFSTVMAAAFPKP